MVSFICSLNDVRQFELRNMNRIINGLHKRALRIAYDGSHFEELLAKDDTETVQKRNLRTLAIEMYKISNNISPLFSREMMTKKCVLYDTGSTIKVEKDSSGDFRCIIKCNYQIPSTIDT